MARAPGRSEDRRLMELGHFAGAQQFGAPLRCRLLVSRTGKQYVGSDAPESGMKTGFAAASALSSIS